MLTEKVMLPVLARLCDTERDFSSSCTMVSLLREGESVWTWRQAEGLKAFRKLKIYFP